MPEFEDSESAAYVFGAENGSRDETILERRTHVVSIPGHECSNLAVPVSRGSRTARHQAGNGRNRSSASSGAGMAVASGSGRRAEYHGWHVGGRERNAGGEERAHPVFQPNSGATHTAWGRDASLTAARPLAAGRSPRSPQSPPASPDRPARRRARRSRLDPAARIGGFALRRQPARPRRQHCGNNRY